MTLQTIGSMGAGLIRGWELGSWEQNRAACRAGGDRLASEMITGLMVNQAISLATRLCPVLSTTWWGTGLRIANIALFVLNGAVQENYLPGQANSRIWQYCARYALPLANIVIAVETVALIYIGQYAFGGTLLVCLIYNKLYQAGKVHYKIQSGVEAYMNPIASLYDCYDQSSYLSRTLSIANILFWCGTSRCTDPAAQKIDALLRSFLPLSGPSLAECQAPLVEKKDMSWEEIKEVLNRPAWEYEINPAHCAKTVMSIEQFKRNEDFDRFLQIYDNMIWEEDRLLRKLRETERFLWFVRDKAFPEDENAKPIVSLQKDFAGLEQTGARLLAHCGKWVEFFAEQEGVSSSEYMRKWIRSELQELVDVLLGKSPFLGEASRLPYMQKLYAIILHDLVSNAQTERQSQWILDIAVNAGGYCGQAQIDEGEEKVGLILQFASPETDTKDPYEKRLLGALQNRRQLYMDARIIVYLKSWFMPDRQARSRDMHKGLRPYFFGVCPLDQTLSDASRSLGQILHWCSAGKWRDQIYTQYCSELDGLVQEQGDMNAVDFLLRVISDRPNPSEDDKVNAEQFREDLANCRDMAPYRRLVLVMLGVLRKEISPISA